MENQKTILEIRDELNNKKLLYNSEIDNKINKIISEKDAFNIKMYELDKTISDLVITLKENNLGLSELTYAFNFERNMLNITFTAIPLNKKVKFYKFNGYDKNGNGKNAKLLENAATELKNNLENKLNLIFVVNRFSFEISDNQPQQSILINTFI